MANARWDKGGLVKPDWMYPPEGPKGNQSRNIICTKRGWVYRLNYTNGYGQKVKHEEVLVAIKDLSNNKITRQPRITEMYTANSTGGTSLKRNSRFVIGVVYDEGLKGVVPAWTLALANTAGGNTATAIANSTIGNANNTLHFNFKLGVAGTYKVQAQTLGGTGNLAADETVENALKVIAGTVSNALGTFTVV